MSTKYLARTVIEGGRARYNKLERYHSNAVERVHAHQLERALRGERDYDDAVFEPRQPVYQGFDDKLGPAYRWLRSQVGRPWHKVHSDIFELFDTRTTAGRHIVFDHLLDEVCLDPTVEIRYARWARFVVTPSGILRYRGRYRPSHAYSYQLGERLPEPEWQARAWLGARRVITHGSRLYWLLPTPWGGFRQQHQLVEAEAARFRALPKWFRENFEGAPPAPRVRA